LGPPKDTSLRETASFDVGLFCVKIGAGVLAVGEIKEEPTKIKEVGLAAKTWPKGRKITHAQNETDLDGIFHVGSNPRLNQLSKFW